MDKLLLRHYSLALYEYAQENKKLEPIYNDLTFVSDVIKKNKEYIKFLHTPTISYSLKESLTKKLFEGSIDSSLYAFILIMIRKDSMYYFDYIYNYFIHLYNEHKGILEGKLYTAILLDNKQIKKLEEVLSKKENKKVSLTQFEDSKIVGGIKVYLNDKVYDYTLEKKINTIKENLLK